MSEERVKRRQVYVKTRPVDVTLFSDFENDSMEFLLEEAKKIIKSNNNNV